LGWILSTAVSANASFSVATGFFEFFIPFAVIYAFVRTAPDRRFMAHSIWLLSAGFGLVSLSLIAAGLVASPHVGDSASIPLFAVDFQILKRNLHYLTEVGGNAYENPDFYISLWVLLLPALLLLVYQTRHGVAGIFLLSLIFYAGFFQYSRAGIIVITLAAVMTIVLRVVISKRWPLLPALLLALLTIAHLDVSTRAYFFNGGIQFEEGLQRLLLHSHRKLGLEMNDDQSGAERIESIGEGIAFGLKHFWTGIGYGMYKRVNPVPPHSTLVYRFVETGILGALSFLLLALYVPFRLSVAFLRREKDMLLYACILATGWFMFKAIVFSASFSLVGIVVWGFAFGVLIAGTIIPKRGCQFLSRHATVVKSGIKPLGVKPKSACASSIEKTMS
jgi:hypothetical protein